MSKEFIKKGPTALLTPEFRVSFPHLFELSRMGKYGVTMLFDKDVDFSRFQDHVDDVVAGKWGNKPPRNLMLPLLDGEESERPEHKDKFYIISKASEKYPPQVVDRYKKEIHDPNEVYAGCFARAIINCFAWTYMGKSGVSVGLQIIQKLRDGVPLAGSVRSVDDFDDIEAEELDDVDDI